MEQPLPKGRRAPDLEIGQILAWADAHHARTGEWPKKHSGFIPEAPRDTWHKVNAALVQGLRGLPAGSSLPRLLAEHRGVRNRKALPPYTEAEILAWADAHRDRTGAWPNGSSGPILDAPGETWTAVEVALVQGNRGLPGGSSLTQLLARHRGARNPRDLPPLTEEQILAWADAHYQRTGEWPVLTSGPILDAPGETWSAIDHALMRGKRGLPGGSTLARLLAAGHGVRRTKPLLSEAQILAWADAHRARTGRWPTAECGAIEGVPGDTWLAIDSGLRWGGRGLPGGSSLAQLLSDHRGRKKYSRRPEITEAQILDWADAHRARTGQWPTAESGPIADAPGETWMAVQMALAKGHRGLPGGSSLARLLGAERGVYYRVTIGPRRERKAATGTAATTDQSP
jgi:hypothetical protein